MKKIAVIGCPGAGKTTFSKELSKRLSLPLYHLDFFHYDESFNYQQDEDAWRQRVMALSQEPSWIIDGNHKSTFDIRFDNADTIIYLDYPLSLTCLRRVPT